MSPTIMYITYLYVINRSSIHDFKDSMLTSKACTTCVIWEWGNMLTTQRLKETNCCNAVYEDKYVGTYKKSQE